MGLENGKLIPNATVIDQKGVETELWDFRQRAHVALMVSPELGEAGLAKASEAANAKRKTWDWLNVKVVITKSAGPDFPDGVYAIDRYGTLLNVFPFSEKIWEEIENEFLTYEAKHC